MQKSVNRRHVTAAVAVAAVAMPVAALATVSGKNGTAAPTDLPCRLQRGVGFGRRLVELP